jgi:hypothetical protein
VAHYDQTPKDLSQKAKVLQATYDGLNYLDDQLDMSDASLAIALSLAAVSALTATWWLLGMAWLLSAGGIVLGLTGFLNWAIHPGWLVTLLT